MKLCPTPREQIRAARQKLGANLEMRAIEWTVAAFSLPCMNGARILTLLLSLMAGKCLKLLLIILVWDYNEINETAALST